MVLNLKCFLTVLFLFYTVAQSSTSITLNTWRFHFFSLDSSITYSGNDTKDSIWSTVTIPHSFNCGEDIAAHTKGFGWYKSKVKINRKSAEDLFLEFGGVSLRCKVFIDGEFAGENRFAYMPFRIPVKKTEKDSITIAIQVDNRLLVNDVPDVSCSAWWVYGGLIREVSLVYLPALRLDHVQLRTVYKGIDSFMLYVACETAGSKPDSLVVKISSAGQKTRVIKTMANDSVLITGIKPWSPEDPVLYEMTVTPFWNGTRGESTSLKRGFSQLYVENGMLWLNGKQIFLRGVGRHDVGVHGVGHGLTRKERLEDLNEIKALGANMLRIAHFPQHRDIYELCDSIGLLVMDEMPAWKSPPDFLGDSIKRQTTLDYMNALIDEHGNYTSIAIWCVGNEINGMNYSIADYVKAMAGFIKKKDPFRLFTYTSFFFHFDKAFEYADLIAINEYFGWYVGSVDLLNPLFKAIQNSFPGKPVIITEFGASAAIGIRNPNAVLADPIRSMITKDFSEDYQALLMTEQIKTIWKNRPITSGAVVWCYNDFMENRKMPNPKILENGITGLGIVTEERKKKLAFNSVKMEFHNIRKEMMNNNGL